MRTKRIGSRGALLALLLLLLLPLRGEGMSGEEFAKLCGSGSAERVRAALEAGADPEATDEYGYSALMLAAESNPDPEVLRLLLSAGADVNREDEEDGTTALFFTAERNPDLRAAALLLEAGADPNVVMRGEDGTTLLMAAVSSNPNPEVVPLLLKGGADLRATDSEGMTALMRAVVENPDPRMTEALLKAGADPDGRSADGRTVSEYAMENPNREVAALVARYAGSASPKQPDESRYAWMDYRRAVFEEYPKGEKVRIHGEVYDTGERYAAVFTRRTAGLGYLEHPVIVRVSGERMKSLRGDRISVAGVYRGTTEAVDLLGRSTRIPVVLAEQYVSRPGSFADSIDDELVDILSTLLR